MTACGYHFEAKPISRSAGRSAVAAASYRTGEKLRDERTGQSFDYTRKQGVEFVHHAAPKDAPAWAHDIEAAWNAVEAAETKKNATLALDYNGAFPHQLDAGQRERILKDFVREEFTRKGFMATAAIHAPGKDGDERNHHAHIMFSYRPLDADGFAKNKDRRFASFASREETLDHLKEKWAELGARQLERAGFQLEAERWRHGHQTLDEQREAALERGDLDYARECEGAATKHLGPVATAIERDGRESHRGNENRAIEQGNRDRAELRAVQAEITGELARQHEERKTEERRAQECAAELAAPKEKPPGKTADEATLTPQPPRPDGMEPAKARERDDSRAGFPAHQNDRSAARSQPTATRQLERVADGMEHGAGAAFRGAARAADTLGDIADRFMSAAADFLVGAPPPRVITEAEYLASEKARREWRAQQEERQGKERQRTAALDRMREDRIAGRTIDSGELAHLSPADLQSIKDRGEAALLDLIRSREIELERQRSRDRGGGRER